MRLLARTMLAGLVVVGTMAANASAQAGIKCSGQFQIVRGQGHIATPYCADEYLAQVARSYGTRVSGAALRRSTSRKEEVCRFIGHDARVFEICIPYLHRGCSRVPC